MELSLNPTPAYSLRQLAGYFFKLGYTGFGGPVALVGYMHRDLVEQKKWISEEDYKEGLALAQMAPGPLAAQLAIYIGFVHYRIPGATLAGLVFIIPSFLIVVALGVAYTLFDGLPWMQAIFYGVGAAVIGIILLSSYKLSIKSVSKLNIKSIRNRWLLWIFLPDGFDRYHAYAVRRGFIIHHGRPALYVMEGAAKKTEIVSVTYVSIAFFRDRILEF